jgi:hypothetical protein
VLNRGTGRFAGAIGTYKDAGHPLQVAGGLLSDGLRQVDSNGDSNSSDQRQASAVSDTQGRSHVTRQTWDIAGLKSGRSEIETGPR